MKKVKLIWRAIKTFLPTPYAALYFGGSDNRVYVIYQKHFHFAHGIPEIEFIIDQSEEFSFDYADNRLIDLLSKDGTESPVFYLGLDSPKHQFKPFKTSRVVKTYQQAEELLNEYIA
jgi:hypothetical protein